MENRYGGSLAETLGGVAMGDITKISKILMKASHGQISKAGEDTLKTAMRNVPFVNLFYTKAAYNYLLFYNMLEYTNPGFKRRMESRMKKTTGQSFFIPPSKTFNQEKQ